MAQEQRPRGGFRETLPAGTGGRILKPGEKPKTAYDPFGNERAPGGRTAKRRYADDLSGFRLMPELTCPNPACAGPLERKFGTVGKGALVPIHAFRCGKKPTSCGWTGIIKGKVLPVMADGSAAKPGGSVTKAEMVAGFKVHLDRLWAEKLPEISLVDRLD